MYGATSEDLLRRNSLRITEFKVSTRAVTPNSIATVFNTSDIVQDLWREVKRREQDTVQKIKDHIAEEVKKGCF